MLVRLFIFKHNTIIMKVFINKIIPETGINMLKESGLEIILPEHENLSYEEWLNYCKNTDTILSIGAEFKYDGSFFEACPNVKAIALYSVGFDHVDIKEATQRGIPVEIPRCAEQGHFRRSFFVDAVRCKKSQL